MVCLGKENLPALYLLQHLPAERYLGSNAYFREMLGERVTVTLRLREVMHIRKV